MSRGKAFLSFVKLFFTDTKYLLKELLKYTNEAEKRIYVQKKLDFKTGLPLVDLAEIVPHFTEEISNYTFLEGTSHTIDIAFIKAVCRQYERCNYLEIGSWRGESLFNISPVVSQCTSISFSPDQVLSRFNNKIMANSLRIFSKGIKNVRHIEADSLTFNFDSINEKFDVIFVDGDHTYEGVKSDTQNAFRMLKDESSIIIFHDCGFAFEDNRYEVIAGIIDGAPPEKRQFIYRVSNTLCGIYTTRKLNLLKKTNPQFPNKVFTVQIKQEPFLT